MARESTQAIPASTASIVRRTDVLNIVCDPNVVPVITATRVKRVNGEVKSMTEVRRALSDVGTQPFGDAGITIAEAAEIIAQLCDQWATEDNEP